MYGSYARGEWECAVLDRIPACQKAADYRNRKVRQEKGRIKPTAEAVNGEEGGEGLEGFLVSSSSTISGVFGSSHKAANKQGSQGFGYRGCGCVWDVLFGWSKNARA